MGSMSDSHLQFLLHEELETSPGHMLIVIRGLPGSGKSTLAKKLKSYFDGAAVSGEDAFHKAEHFEADMFFTKPDGSYNWTPQAVGYAHKWCQESVSKALEDHQVVIVSNTFTQMKEINPYLEIASKASAKVVVLSKDLNVNYGNVHGVPSETLTKMKERWVPFKGEIIL